MLVGAVTFYMPPFTLLTSDFFFFFFQNPEEKGETEEVGDASKSEISLVYEIALKRNLSVNFEVRKIVSWAIVSHKQFHISI